MARRDFFHFLAKVVPTPLVYIEKIKKMGYLNRWREIQNSKSTNSPNKRHLSYLLTIAVQLYRVQDMIFSEANFFQFSCITLNYQCLKVILVYFEPF